VVDAAGNRIPDCPTAERQPIPASLRIEYAEPSTVTINTKPWDYRGLTPDMNGKPVRFPFHAVSQPNPPPQLEVWLLFRSDGSTATAAMLVVALDQNDKPTCSIAYEFAGTYQP
jgi:hypothetical protein